MSILNGKFRPRGGLTGKVENKTPRLQVIFRPRNDAPRVTIISADSFGGSWARAGKFFAGAVKRLPAIYRFLVATMGIPVGLRAKANAAPAVDVKAEGTAETATKASAAAARVAATKVDQKEKLSVLAKLVAYNRAAAVYISNILTGRAAGLSAADGAVVKFRKGVSSGRTAELDAAEGHSTESKETVRTGAVAVGGAVNAEETAAVSVFSNTSEAAANAADGTGVAAISSFRAAHGAKLFAWFLEELEGATLTLHQIYSGIQSGNVLEIDIDAESAFWANAMVTDGTLNLVFAESATPNNTTLEVS